MQRSLALSWSESPPFMVLWLHLGVSLGPIDYGEDPGIPVPGLFHACLLVAGSLPFRNAVTSGAGALALRCARSMS